MGFVGERPNSPRALGNSSQSRPHAISDRTGSGRMPIWSLSVSRSLKSFLKIASTSGGKDVFDMF
jgi:hypothetical protein